MPQSSQLAGDVRAHQGDTQVCGHQPLSNCSVGPGAREALVSVVGDGEPGEACPWIYGIMCSPAVPRLAPLGCRVPMSPQLSLPSLLRNLPPLCAGTPSHQHMALQGCPAWKAQHRHCPAQSQQVPGMLQSWGWGVLGQGPGLTRGWEDPREFAARLGWTHRVLWEQGLGAGLQPHGGW